MPSLDITAKIGSNVSGTGNPWSGLGNTALEDSVYASIPAGSNLNPLALFTFDQAVPENIKIDGLEVILKARVSSGTGTPVLNVKFIKDTNLSSISTTKTTTTLSTSLGTFTLGSSTDLWESGLKRETLIRPYFGLLITPSGSTDRSFEIDQVILRVNYSTTGFLVGASSKFSRRVNTEYDVPDYVFNGTAPSNQVTSKQMNYIGDCLYSMEDSLLQVALVNDPVYTDGAGSNKVFATTITVSGTINAPVSGLIEYQKFYAPDQFGAPTSVYTNLASAVRSNFVRPELNKKIIWNVVSGIGWVNSGGTNTPLFVQPNLHFTNFVGTPTNPRTGYHLSLIASTKNPIGSYSGGILTGSPSIAGYNYSTIVSSLGVVPSGTVTIKIFALGRYGV